MNALKEKLGLKADELKELIGGVSPQCAGTDVNNNNTVPSCKCQYYNASSMNNNNSVDGCTCECVGRYVV